MQIQQKEDDRSTQEDIIAAMVSVQRMCRVCICVFFCVCVSCVCVCTYIFISQVHREISP